MTAIRRLPEHHCDYCGGAFNGRAYYDVDDYDTVCAHCCVELLLAQRQQLQGAVATAADAISLAEHLIPYAPQHKRARFFVETAELRKLNRIGGNKP